MSFKMTQELCIIDFKLLNMLKRWFNLISAIEMCGDCSFKRLPPCHVHFLSLILSQ